jgi:hypothetical protein
MTTTQKLASAVAAVFVLVAGLAMLSFTPRPSPKIACSCVGISTLSNASRIAIAINNRSASSIVYFVGEPLLKSNGTWGVFQYPAGTKLLRLGAGQSATGEVPALSASGEAKVPVLWGFTYSPNATRWQEIREDVAAYFHMHDLRGRGALYTNFVTGIKL